MLVSITAIDSHIELLPSRVYYYITHYHCLLLYFIIEYLTCNVWFQIWYYSTFCNPVFFFILILYMIICHPIVTIKYSQFELILWRVIIACEYVDGFICMKGRSCFSSFDKTYIQSYVFMIVVNSYVRRVKIKFLYLCFFLVFEFLYFLQNYCTNAFP